MSDLTGMERRKLERLLTMGGGYVLNFSNRTLDEFVLDSTNRSIYDGKYNRGSGSKANQMRGFWEEEPNPVVAKLLSDLIDYAESERLCSDPTLAVDCRMIVSRLKESAGIAEIDAILRIGDEHDLDVVARAVLDLVEKKEFAAGLDRLHTFTTGFLRSLCEKRGLTSDRGKPLHSLFGEFVRTLHQGGHIQSRMTASILKALNGPLDAFNDVRNNQSLAHDNQLLNYEEAMLIFNHVTSSLRFLRDLEKRVERAKRIAAQAEAAIGPTDDSDIPF
jgi:hypothetical protein